jgi:hypothetical protein
MNEQRERNAKKGWATFFDDSRRAPSTFLAHADDNAGMELHLHLSPEFEAQVRELLPRLERQAVSSLSVSSYCRPGEPRFWLAYLYVAGRRHVCATPDLREKPLTEQWPELLRQLHAFDPRDSRPAYDE